MPVMEIIERTTTRFEAVEIGPHFDIVECHEIVCARCSRVVWA